VFDVTRLSARPAKCSNMRYLSGTHSFRRLAIVGALALTAGCSGGAPAALPANGPPAALSGQIADSAMLALATKAFPYPQVGGCRMFPADNPWNTDISKYPLDPHSAQYMAEMNPAGSIHLHPDFGSDLSYGIPYNVVDLARSAYVPIKFVDYPAESDPGPYPIPAAPHIEAGSDRHMLIVNSKTCVLYETWLTEHTAKGWTAGNGAVWPLDTNKLRPEGWTSADAAGLPILAGLVRYDEVTAGAVNHAIRFTLDQTAHAHIHPATHDAGNSNAVYAPPMGLRLRLKANFDLAPYHGEALVILTAMKRYGLILADNGSNFFFTGATDGRWNDDSLNTIKEVPASAFEVVHTGSIIKD
jgi:hypothetical protein